MKIKANEPLTIHGDWNWADTNYSPDWSIVAWGDKGGLSLTHLKGLASNKLPLLERNEVMQPTDDQGTGTGEEGNCTDRGDNDND